MSTRPARQKILAKVRQLKSDTPCADCGENYPYYVMQFDHVIGTKFIKINRMVYTSSFHAVMEEIAKCEVVCANCHHSRTFNRQQKRLAQ